MLILVCWIYCLARSADNRLSAAKNVADNLLSAQQAIYFSNKPVEYECMLYRCILYHVNLSRIVSAFVFATRIVQFLYFLNPKFQASSHLWLYSSVCVGPGLKPQRPVFSQRGSFDSFNNVLVHAFYPIPYIHKAKCICTAIFCPL